MSIDRSTLLAAIDRLSAAAERDFEMLNSADGALGDGDLGITIERGMKLVSEQKEALDSDIGRALMQCAQAFTKTSGSSYGTLLATGLMSMAKALKGNTNTDASAVSDLVAGARDAMIARGKAELGGKTVLDSLDAIVAATAGETEPALVADAAAKAVDDALDNFRDVQSTVGRARMFGEKTIGMDDPGMLAMRTIVKAIANREASVAA